MFLILIQAVITGPAVSDVHKCGIDIAHHLLDLSNIDIVKQRGGILRFHHDLGDPAL